MGLSIVRFADKDVNESRWGVLEGETVYPLSGTYERTSDLIAAGIVALRAQADRAAGIAYETLSLLSPVTETAKLICLGVNYAPHREEAGLEAKRPDQMLIFSKDNSSITGPHHDIIKPVAVDLLDYEIELGLVIGKSISAPTNFERGKLYPYVAGLVICDDVSARCEQFGHPFLQWFQGKSYRTFCPIGPVLYLLEESDESLIYQLQLELTVNDEIRQKATTMDLMFQPEEALTTISSFANLNIGDVVMTGTPGGVALSFDAGDTDNLSGRLFQDAARRKAFIESQNQHKEYLNIGDKVVATITSLDGSVSLGTQTNYVINA